MASTFSGFCQQSPQNSFCFTECTGCFPGQDPYSCFSELKRHGKILLTQTLNLHCLKTMLSTHMRERKKKTKTKTGILKEWHCKWKHLNTAKHKFLFYAKLQKSSLCIVFTGYGLWLCWESLRFFFFNIFFSFFWNPVEKTLRTHLCVCNFLNYIAKLCIQNLRNKYIHYCTYILIQKQHCQIVFAPSLLDIKTRQN